MTATPEAVAAKELPTRCASGQQNETNGEWIRHVVFWGILFICVCGFVGIAASMYWVYWTGQDEVKQPLYHAAVDAVTGLDLATDLGRPTLNPEFNLTVGLASRSVTTGWCFCGGSTVKVSYLDVELASGALPRLCVGPRPSGEQGSVVAWGNAVAVPRMVRDALASDLRRGAAEFDVELTVAEAPHAISWVVVSCRTKVSQSEAPRIDVAGPVSYGRSPPVVCA